MRMTPESDLVAATTLIVAEAYAIKPTEIHGKSRTSLVVEARHVALWILRQFDLTYAKIGEFFDRDHSSVLHGVQKIQAEVIGDENVKKRMATLLETVRGRVTEETSVAGSPDKSGGAKVRPSIRKPKSKPPGQPPQEFPACRLVITTTPHMIEKLVRLLMTGVFGRTLGEVADRLLSRGLESVAHLLPDTADGVWTAPYVCRACGHTWLGAFDAKLEPAVEYSVECPKCGLSSGEPITGP